MECPLCCKRKPIRQKKEKKTYEIVSKLLSSIFQRNIVATLATKPELLVARRKVLVALVTGISVAILSGPVMKNFVRYTAMKTSFKLTGLYHTFWHDFCTAPYINNYKCIW